MPSRITLELLSIAEARLGRDQGCYLTTVSATAVNVTKAARYPPQDQYVGNKITCPKHALATSFPEASPKPCWNLRATPQRLRLAETHILSLGRPLLCAKPGWWCHGEWSPVWKSCDICRGYLRNVHLLDPFTIRSTYPVCSTSIRPSWYFWKVGTSTTATGKNW